MEHRTRPIRRIALGLSVIFVFAAAAPGFAQTGMEYPRTMPGGGSYGGGGYGGSVGGGGSISAPAPSGSGASKTTVIPYHGGPDTPPGSTPEPRAHRARVRKAIVPEDRGPFEPASGRFKLIKNSYAYERPTTSSSAIEPVTAGKYVNAMGISKSYLQVKLKNSEIAYVPVSAVSLVNPTDKFFKLTADASVRSVPHESGRKIAEVHRGHDVHVVGVAPNYMKIRMKSGVEGYIPVSALE